MKKRVLWFVFVLLIFRIPTLSADFEKPMITDWPIKNLELRRELTYEYSFLHYGKKIETIEPQAIVVHWTATDTAEGAYNYFYSEESTNPFHKEVGRLNVAAHFIVDRNGEIYRLTPETQMNRHTIGLNWCAIGIENVGGINGREDLTEKQLNSNLALIKYLMGKYPQIKYVLGHYQYVQTRGGPLWVENIPEYYSAKTDPGPIFMTKLMENLQSLPIRWFKI